MATGRNIQISYIVTKIVVIYLGYVGSDWLTALLTVAGKHVTDILSI